MEKKKAPETSAPKKVSKQQKRRWFDILTIPSFSGRAELRQTNNVLVVVVFCLLVGMLWQDCNYRSGYYEISKGQWMVVKENCSGETSLSSATDYQSGPDEMTVKSIAVNVVKLVQEAGTESIDNNFSQVRKLLTDAALKKFDDAAQKQKEDLKDLKESRNLSIYRKIPPNDLFVRPITEKDFPPGAKINLTKFDIAVYGKVVTYDSATNMQITVDDFFFYIRTSPLENRTVENIWGLKIESITPLNPKESVAAIEKAKEDAEKNKPTTAESMLPSLSGNSNTSTNSSNK
jgi:hypothetical protein